MKQTINTDNLTGSQATALLVLAPKAYYAQVIPKKNWFIDFSKAKEITEKIDLRKFSGSFGRTRVGKTLSAVLLAVRSKAMEELVDKYLTQYPEAVLVQFGCGLSDRSQRYMQRAEQGLPFYDVDFPDMIALRRNFYEETENYKMIASDLSNYTWIEEIPENHRGKQFIFVAEGVSPYLSEQEMKDLFAKLEENFPGCLIIMDFYSTVNVRMAARFFKWKYNADLKFANDNPQQIVAWRKDGAYAFLEEDNLIFRDDFLNDKYFTGLSALSCVIKGLPLGQRWLRSTVILVYRLGVQAQDA